ncbi:hypothetical protein NLG97_g2206 [Lecanicillium saksenae]|uniref:Uncharacterized protein n=1 Tax=Lecanicillium saksenae TaxID=468837 RepID=A0ACC1R3G5_9HYPO|nr:hypothetical protein NLG97_g2206 [Lecanicillium saksenae]
MAAYSLVNSYAGNALINGFNWVDGHDYSNGFVKYQSQANAASRGLFAVDEQTGVVRIGVDHHNTYEVSGGRPSVRIESKEAYNHGLFIADFLHMPPSQCGVWPAFWAYGPDWPRNGEIDIIEGANTVHRNIISAHTTPGCKLGEDVLSMASGNAQTKNCDIGDQNIGCGYVPPTRDTSSYGDTFNAVGGGIYAMQWDDDYIKVWHFDRNTAPADISAKKPKPDSWGKPQAVYGGKSCDVKSHFRDMSIVLNINFCGDYGNAMWSSSGCSALAPTCSEWVAKNPAAFANAYWDVNYIDAYVQGPGGSHSPSGTIGSQSQPSNIPTASFTHLPGTAGSNGTYTRFPVGNISSNAFPTNPSTSESTSWTTTTRTDTTTVTVPGNIPTATLPAPSGKAHHNPANLNDFSYLGCFGSNSDFKSFDKVADSPDMDLKKCTGLCKGKKYAGVFDTSCYCASELDADTRVSADTCDTQCPGDSSQFCGGRIKKNGKFNDNGIGAKANITLPETSSYVSGIAMPLETDGGSRSSSGETSNMTSPEQPVPSGSGSPIVKANSTAPETPNVVNPAAKFNSTGPQIIPAISSSSIASSSASSTIESGPSTGYTSTTGVIAPAKFNLTGPEIPAPASTSSETTSADGPVVTIPVYPQPKEKNVTGLESQQTTSSSVGSSSVSSNSVRSNSASFSTASPTIASSAVAESSPAPEVLRNSTLVGRGIHAARSMMYKNIRPGMMDRREAADFLLTIYAAIAKEEPPKQPPGMGIHTANANAAADNTSTVVTTITYQTVHPTNPAQIINQEYVTTIVKVHCGCTESTSTATPIPMTTKVVPCSSCGPQGENHLTVTVPHTVTISTPAPATNTPIKPSSGTASSVRIVPTSPPIVAGASGLKATSLLFTTMLAMVLLL